MTTQLIIPGVVVIQPISPESYMIMKIRKVLLQKKSKYQNIEIVELSEYGKALILDGLVQSTQVDEYIYHESLVHPAMITHPNPRRVLIIGGGEGATLREVLKHSTVEEAVMVDIDEDVVEICKQHLSELHAGSLYSTKARIVITDGKEFVEKTIDKYDVVILDLTDPYASEIAYELYTEKFYRRIYSILSEDGLMVTQAGSSFYYEETYNRVLDSVKRVFPIVKEYNVWIPSFGYACNFIIGSKKYDSDKLSREEVDERLRARNVSTRFYSGKTHIALMNMPIYRKERTIS